MPGSRPSCDEGVESYVPNPALVTGRARNQNPLPGCGFCWKETELPCASFAIQPSVACAKSPPLDFNMLSDPTTTSTPERSVTGFQKSATGEAWSTELRGLPLCGLHLTFA